MKCPVCDQEMKMLPEDISYSPRQDNKEYIRTVYQCKTDDAWVTIELPKPSE